MYECWNGVLCRCHSKVEYISFVGLSYLFQYVELNKCYIRLQFWLSRPYYASTIALQWEFTTQTTVSIFNVAGTCFGLP